MTSRLPDPAFWRDRRVFLTGHTGFKGAWLGLWLHRLGARVHGFALPPESSSLAADLGTAHLVSTHGDIRDPAALAAAVAAADPEIVLHLAAQSLVRVSYRAPIDTFATNVMGTAHVIEAARHAPRVRALVCVTSDKCYENREWSRAYRETDALGGHDPYSASKACAEILAASWRRSFLTDRTPPLALATARAGNVIGGGDWAADRLIPDCIRAFVAGRTVAIRNPRATRPWQHVLEPLCGYLILAETLFDRGTDAAAAWNFGPPAADVRPVADVVARLAQTWGDGAAWRIDAAPQPHEAGTLAVDAARARARLGWRPRLTLETALDWTARWYRAGTDPARLVLRDIENYEIL